MDDVMMINSLVCWLESRPADEEFSYVSHGDCLLARYFEAKGFGNPWVYSLGQMTHGPVAPPRTCYLLSEDLKVPGRQLVDYPMEFNAIVSGFPSTIENAIKRARGLAA